MHASPQNGPRAAAFDVEFDGDVDYIHVAFHNQYFPASDPICGLQFIMAEREMDLDVPDILVIGLCQPAHLGLFTGPEYETEEPWYFDRDDVITQTFVVDVDMDTDLDLILVAGQANRIYWFENIPKRFRKISETRDRRHQQIAAAAGDSQAGESHQEDRWLCVKRNSRWSRSRPGLDHGLRCASAASRPARAGARRVKAVEFVPAAKVSSATPWCSR